MSRIATKSAHRSACWCCGLVGSTGCRLRRRAAGGDAGCREAVNVLVGVEGNGQIKRQGWSDYAPALFGMILRSGDLLRLDSGGQATVACSDLTVAKATGGVSSVPCKVSKPLLVYGGSLILPTRADAPADIPLVLSPRKTKMLSARPCCAGALFPAPAATR